MKKFGKFLAATFSLAAILGGAYYIYQKFIKESNDESEDIDDFDDFEDFDNFDDFDDDLEESDKSATKDKAGSAREYVTLDMDNLNATSEEKADEEADQEDVTVIDLISDEENENE